MSEPSPYVYNDAILPPYLKEQLTTWPASGSGTRAVHRHIITLANGLRHYVTAEEAVELIKAGIPRKPKGREVEDTVKRAYNLNKVAARNERPPALSPDIDVIDETVTDNCSGSALADLTASSPAPIPGSTEEAMYQLFEPEALICHAWDQPQRAVTRQLRQIIFNNGNGIAIPELIVPSPMSAPYVLDQAGKRHYRTNANTGPRKFIVTDFDIKPGNPIYADLIAKWAKHKVTIQDAMAAIIKFLAGKGPLVMVVFSGHISLQAWFFCEGEREALNSRLRGFFEDAVLLGADKAGWTPCQFFRMPGALRSDTGLRQTIHFFNPSHTLQQ